MTLLLQQRQRRIIAMCEGYQPLAALNFSAKALRYVHAYRHTRMHVHKCRSGPTKQDSRYQCAVRHGRILPALTNPSTVEAQYIHQQVQIFGTMYIRRRCALSIAPTPGLRLERHVRALLEFQNPMLKPNLRRMIESSNRHRSNSFWLT